MWETEIPHLNLSSRTVSGQCILGCKEQKLIRTILRKTRTYSEAQCIPGQEVGELGHREFDKSDSANPRARAAPSVADRSLRPLVSVPALISYLSSHMGFFLLTHQSTQGQEWLSQACMAFDSTWPICLLF